MQQAEHRRNENRTRDGGAGQTLTAQRESGESSAELAHDARNMVTALALYCELLAEPGVLTHGAGHYVQELQVVTAASRRILEKLARVEERAAGNSPGTRPWRSSPLIEALPGTRVPRGARETAQAGTGSRVEIEDLAGEMEINSNLLAALAGPGVKLRFKVTDGSCPVGLKGEDLTRILVNLVRNSTEAMHGSGSITIALTESTRGSGRVPNARLTIEDSGPGFPAADLEQVFENGYSSSNLSSKSGDRSRKATGRRGLGLYIVRNLIEAAGGRVAAWNCVAGGARIVIELPILNG
jgi:signal transduction histidine kinase